MIDFSRLPLNWIIVTLGELSSLIQYGLNATAEQEGEEFLYLRISNINDDGTVNLANPTYLSQKIQDLAKYILEPGDIVIARSGSVGRSFVYRSSDKPWVFASYLIRFRIKQDLADPDYIGFFMRSLSYRKYIDKMSISVAQANINSKELSKLPIPLPPLSEQRRIVAILREADELRHLRRKAKEKTQNILPAIFYEMFQNPNEWKKTISLEKLVSFVGGGTPNRKIQRYFEGNIPWAKFKDIGSRYLNDTQEHITEEAIKNSTTNLVPAGTVLIAVKNKILVPLLPIGITTRPFCFEQDIKGLICFTNVKPQFIAAALSVQARHILNQTRGVNTEGLTLEILKRIQIPDVDLSKQEEFTKRVIEYDQIEESSFNFAHKSESLFQSLIAQAFTGELTATWREQHQEELAAAKRDQLLQISQPVNVEELADKGARETKRLQLYRDRDELLRSLSKSQYKIYKLVIQETAYFTPEHLEEKYSIPRNIGQKNLQLLAAVGLIVSVTLPTPTSNGLNYESAYRNLNQDDDSRYSDVTLLTKDAV
ncbi:restriction endonuclease subunit S [Nostoc sp. CCY 9925]|uniref:restriction endonuclease subunit S n=1 Tax=Nostoc sp. CCY 9925 TaxID=3103865 RepID=UPI0039C6779D